MSDGSADRPSWRERWALPTDLGGWVFVLLLGGLLVWFWGTMAWGWLSLAREVWALPSGLRGIIATMAGLIALLIYWAVQHDKALKRLQQRLAELEWSVRQGQARFD